VKKCLGQQVLNRFQCATPACCGISFSVFIAYLSNKSTGWFLSCLTRDLSAIAVCFSNFSNFHYERSNENWGNPSASRFFGNHNNEPKYSS
jgi:hypothetical protein